MKTVRDIKMLLRGCDCDEVVSLEKIGNSVYLKVGDEYFIGFDRW